MEAMVMKIACIVLVYIAVVTPHVEALTCGQVMGTVLSCLNYLRTGGPLPGPCCSGVRALNKIAQNTPDRRQACTCVQNSARSYNIIPNVAAGVPGRCGVTLPYRISLSTDCSKVK